MGLSLIASIAFFTSFCDTSSPIIIILSLKTGSSLDCEQSHFYSKIRGEELKTSKRKCDVLLAARTSRSRSRSSQRGKEDCVTTSSPEGYSKKIEWGLQVRDKSQALYNSMMKNKHATNIDDLKMSYKWRQGVQFEIPGKAPRKPLGKLACILEARARPAGCIANAAITYVPM